jgi:hypothetical protein
MTKPILPALVFSLLAASGLAHADNDRWHSRPHGFDAHERWEHREGHRHFRRDWDISPLAAIALIGTTAYLANNIANEASNTTVIVSPPVQVAPPRTAYFCPATQQYYPVVPSCPMPWQLVNY